MSAQLLQVLALCVLMALFAANYVDLTALYEIAVPLGWWLAANAFVIALMSFGVSPALQISVLIGLNVILPIVVFFQRQQSLL